MIHGGPRYLEFDWRTTKLSCEDAGKIVRIARHLIYRVVFLIPVLARAKLDIEKLETGLELYDRYQPLKGSHPHARLSAADARRLEPGLSENVTGALTMEEWGVDVHRLTWLNVLDALEQGARAANHSCVEGFIRDGARVIGVTYRGPDGAHHEARARVVINASGPWSPLVARLAGTEVRLRPAKGVHIVYDRRLSNFAVSTEAVDGRDLLLVPHGSFTLVGTTDDDFYGDPDDVEVLNDEVDYILEAFDRVFPSLRRHRAIRATSAVRPTLYEWRPNEDNLSRRHELIDHEARDGIPGLVTITGGKLSMYRLMAEETADLVCSKIGVQVACSTGSVELPGSEGEPEPVEELATRQGFTLLAAARLLRRHGCRSERVLAASQRSGLVCRCEAVSEAELIHAARNEQVRSLSDAFRRVGLAAGTCSGTLCLRRAGEIVGRELGWSRAQIRQAVADEEGSLWRGRSPVLDATDWAQAELAYGARTR